MRKKQTADAVTLLDGLVDGDLATRRHIEAERINAEVAREIRQLRTARGLTQKQLAEKVGTTQSVIARLEDADYAGHSLRMLRRIAEALDARLVVRLVS